MNAEPAATLAGYVLAGGKSLRFGSNKALALLQNEPLIVHAVRQLAECTHTCTVVAERAHRYADLGLRTIADRTAHQGPLGGLHAALRDLTEHGGRWLLLTSCDRIGLRCEWIESLHAAATRTPGTLAAAFHDDQHWHPLPALFHRQLLPEVERQLTSSNHALHQLLDHCQAQAVEVPPDWDAGIDINHRRDLDRLETTSSARLSAPTTPECEKLRR